LHPFQVLIASGVAAALALCAVALISSGGKAQRVEALSQHHQKAALAARHHKAPVRHAAHEMSAKAAKAYAKYEAHQKEMQAIIKGIKPVPKIFSKKEFKSDAKTAGVGMPKRAAKAFSQKLDDISSEFDPIEDADSNYARTLGVREPSRTNGAVPEDMDVSPERKARVQSLDDISSEFDPIEDADSNYARTLGVREPSRTNGVVPEDMDVSPERKAPVQMLYDVDGPQPSDGSRSRWARAGAIDGKGARARRPGMDTSTAELIRDYLPRE
jgi:hypothetical protein